MNRWQVPLVDVVLGPEEIEAVTQVLQSGWLSMGPKTQEFEVLFAQFLGVKHAFAVASWAPWLCIWPANNWTEPWRRGALPGPDLRRQCQCDSLYRGQTRYLWM